MSQYDRVHSACKKVMKPLPVRSNIGSSEYYCEACHHSEKMPEEAARHFIDLQLSVERAAQHR